MMERKNQDLQEEATRLLREAGHTWAGRDKRQAPSREQVAFERRRVQAAGFGGYSRKRV